MTLKNESIFNLIEIFRSSPKQIMNTIIPKTHCEHKHLHDYYCDAENPTLVKKEKMTSLREL